MDEYEKKWLKRLRCVIDQAIHEPDRYTFFMNGPVECYISKDDKPIDSLDGAHVSTEDILRSIGMKGE